MDCVWLLCRGVMSIFRGGRKSSAVAVCSLGALSLVTGGVMKKGGDNNSHDGGQNCTSELHLKLSVSLNECCTHV